MPAGESEDEQEVFVLKQQDTDLKTNVGEGIKIKFNKKRSYPEQNDFEIEVEDQFTNSFSCSKIMTLDDEGLRASASPFVPNKV